MTVGKALGLGIVFMFIFALLVIVTMHKFDQIQSEKSHQHRNDPYAANYTVQGVIESIRQAVSNNPSGRGVITTYDVNIAGKEYSIDSTLWNGQQVGDIIELTGDDNGIFSIKKIDVPHETLRQEWSAHQ